MIYLNRFFRKTVTALLSAAIILGSSVSALSQAAENVISVSGKSVLKISKSVMSVGYGESVKLTADQSVKWRTSSSKILTVDQKGNVKAVGNGTAWITARNNSGVEKSCRITVKNAPSLVGLSKTILTLGIGETYTLSSIIPDESACASRTFRTSDSSIIKMTKTDWTGSFRAMKTGVAWVTVRTYNGKEKSCRITVKKAPDRVTLSKKSMTLVYGKTASLSSLIASDAGCATRTFRTSNSSIIKMTKTNWTGSFKAVGAGTAWVTVRTYNGMEASCKIVVPAVPATTVKVSKASEKMFSGKTLKLTAAVSPSNTTDKISWMSSNESVAAVSDGIVKAVAPGKAKIIAKSGSGKLDYCIVTVKKSASESDTMGKTRIGAVPYTISELNGYYKPDGTFTNAGDYACGYVTVDVNEGDVFLYKGRGTGNAVSVIFYDKSDNIVETMQFDETRFHEIIIPDGVTKAFFTSSTDLRTAARLTFELHNNGTIKNSDDTQSSVSSSFTLNTADRLSACMTLGQAKHIKKLDRAVVCIGFDDYNLDCLSGVQYLNEHNIKSYLAVIPDNVTDNWDLAHTCYDNGGEIVAHSRITLNSENQTSELMNEKFIKLPSIIRQNGFPVYGIIRAGGAGVGTESRILDELYCRAAGLRYSDYYGTVNPYRLTRENMTHRTLQEWKSYFDDLVTNKEYVILYCHHLDGSEKNAYPDGFTFSDFTGIVREIQSRNIDVMTINEFVDRYIYGVSDSGTSAR